MNLELLRISQGANDTLGLLFDVSGETNEFLCFTLEDTVRERKIYGMTCIPEGIYRLKLRTWGVKHQQYKVKYDGNHFGMIEICDVPEFSDVLIHIGNTHRDTSGCVLIGNGAIENITGDGMLLYSERAYRRVYRRIAGALVAGEATFLRIRDLRGVKKDWSKPI